MAGEIDVRGGNADPVERGAERVGLADVRKALAFGARAGADHQQKLDARQYRIWPMSLRSSLDGVTGCQDGDKLRLGIGHRGDAQITGDADDRRTVHLR